MQHTNDNKATSVTVSASLLRAALTFAGTRDVRYYLNGVLVEPMPDGNGVLLIATDGHRLAVLHDPAGNADGWAIVARHKLPTLRKADAGGLATFDGARGTYPGGTSLPVEFIDGRFPDWRAVIPNVTAESLAPGSFNAAYLGDLEAVGKGYGVPTPFAAIYACGDRSALVRFGSLPALVVLMPCRDQESAPELPAFMAAGTPARMLASLERFAAGVADARRVAAAHPGEPARRLLVSAACAWLAQVRRCKAAGLATVQPAPLPAAPAPSAERSSQDAAEVAPAAPRALAAYRAARGDLVPVLRRCRALRAGLRDVEFTDRGREQLCTVLGRASQQRADQLGRLLAARRAWQLEAGLPVRTCRVVAGSHRARVATGRALGYLPPWSNARYPAVAADVYPFEAARLAGVRGVRIGRPQHPPSPASASAAPG